MGKYFIGKGVQLLTEETENKLRIYKLGLLAAGIWTYAMHQWECIHFSIGRRRRNTVCG